MRTTYRFLDYFKQEYVNIPCDVVQAGDKTAKIRLLRFGANGTPPNSIIRVHKKSLECYKVDNKKKATYIPYFD